MEEALERLSVAAEPEDDGLVSSGWLEERMEGPFSAA